MQLGQTMSLLFLIRENTNLQVPLPILFLFECAWLVARVLALSVNCPPQPARPPGHRKQSRCQKAAAERLEKK